VILVENCPALGDVDRSPAGFVPGEGNHPLEEGAHDAELGRSGRHLIQPRQLAIRLLARLRREIRLLDLLAKLAGFEVLGIGFPELPLDASHLLAEHELALGLVQLLGGVGGDLPLQLLHCDLVLQDLHQPTQLSHRRVGLEDFLPHAARHRNRAGHEVGDLDVSAQVLEHAAQIPVDVGAKGEQALEERAHCSR